MMREMLVSLLLVVAGCGSSGDQPRANSQEGIPRSQADSSCLRYEPQVVELNGTLTIEDHFGPPNYGETPDQDERLQVPVLVMDSPVDVCGDPGSETNSESFRGVTRIQVIPSESGIAKRLAGSNVVAAGVLFRAMSGHHYTDVVLQASRLARRRGG